MKNSKASDVAILAIFIAIMVVVQILSQIVYSVWPLPIVPTLLHIPVIIGSIVLGSKKGAFLGLVMGIISVVNATVVTLPSSFMFSPLQPIPGTNHGSIWALVIAIVPRILIGVFPYYIYKMSKNQFGAGLAAFVGTATNTVLVLGFIFLFFRAVTKQTFGALLASIITGNSIAEVVIAVILTMAIVPALSKARGNQ
ncbi:ECF transporter S component [Lactococcus protaetiae]|uniref:ECF transporter S component n=1 Tax=Lactococcus protaetiae TaxID=2592653 RepID=A0A514Z7Y5_9LACT|nr:ECF transporter S component [Lactococcus protaetiae]MCL2113098.1 ECF transporter S component [Streptococcaceae bacterium]QDK70704.1 ECF transporter S component [Lactococcus protaetiae]